MKFLIFTSSALPFKCGPSYAAYHRAMGLQRLGHNVRLVCPKISDTDDKQRAEMYSHFSDSVPLEFYNTFFIESFSSYFFADSFERFVHADDDVVVLEEPEHLLWLSELYNGPRMNVYTVGIIHTNYYNMTPRIIHWYNYMNVAMYCDTVFHISGSLDFFRGSIFADIHGVDDKFLSVPNGAPYTDTRFYYCGQINVPFKCLDNLISLCADALIQIDLFGVCKRESDEQDIHRLMQTHPDTVRLMGAYTSLTDFAQYKVYVSSSTNEGLCTATLKAIAMHKFCIIPRAPCNASLANHPNVCMYDNPKEFCTHVQRCIQNQPVQNTYDFSWTSNTANFLACIETHRKSFKQ